MTEDQESAALSDDGSAVDRLFEWATLYEARIYCGALWHERNGWRRRALAAEAEREQAQVLVDALRGLLASWGASHQKEGD